MCVVKIYFVILLYSYTISTIIGVQVRGTVNNINATRIRRQLGHQTGISCILPQHPENGRLTLVDDKFKYLPGTFVPHFTSLQINCMETSKLDGPKVTLCFNGEWSHKIGECLRTCKPLQSTLTMTVTCTFKEKKRSNCNESLEDTIARFRCAPFYENKGQSIHPAYCVNGTWSHSPPECVPVCGQKSVNDDPTLILNGTVVKKGDYPWQVAIYSTTNKQLLCGGSLLNERVVLTAAHCITNDKGQLLSKELYTIAVGKYYRKYDDERDSNEAQFSTIQEMFIPRQYKGSTQNYFGDIGMLVAKKTFKLSTRVQPVCVDWNSEYQKTLSNPTRTQKGFVTGWGYKAESGEPSEELRELSVPLIDFEKCSVSLPEEYDIYMTDDKICAGYFQKGTSVCKGDSGGGLVFKYGKRYFIFGIVSLAPRSTNTDGCDSQTYGLYTIVSHHLNTFILQIEARFKPGSLIDDVSCNDGSCIDTTSVSSSSITARFDTNLPGSQFVTCHNNSNTFHCKSGGCINSELECDGKVACPDGSDETSHCHAIRCPGYFFRCAYGGCINSELKCDGKVDCKDGSDEGSECKNANVCTDNEYRCVSGQCIKKANLCDGKAECSDHSDETQTRCRNVFCPRIKFRCKYGACVDSGAECNGVIDCFDGSDENPIICERTETTTTIQTTPNSETPKNDCILPDYPQFGKWFLQGVPGNFTPGMAVKTGASLNVNCTTECLSTIHTYENGRWTTRPVEPCKTEIVHSLNSSNVIFCDNGKWTPPMGQCLRTCRSLFSTDSTKVTCVYKDKETENCTNVFSETVAKFQCAPLYENSALSRQPIVCINGWWNQKTVECVPACGRSANISEDNFPWYVAIYTNSPTKRILCGGSLISLRLIVTAAHCVTDRQGKLEPVGNLIVAVGKSYMEFNDVRDNLAQLSELQKMFIPDRYRGDLQNFIGDIAILVTKKSFVLSENVSPVCVDWDSTESHFGLPNQAQGYVPAWTTPSNKLKAISAEEVDRNSCLDAVPEFFATFFTPDKICARTQNEESLCDRGSSTFLKKKNGRYYITGISSVTPRSEENNKCTSPEYIFYTNINKYTSFLLEIEAMFKP